MTDPIHFVPDPQCVNMSEFEDFDDPFGAYMDAFKEFMHGPRPLPAKGWYFWDEVWADRLGPYKTRKAAEEQLERYANYLEGLSE